MKIAIAPTHTFSETVIVNDKIFHIKQWYDHPVEIDCVVVPFTLNNGRPFETWTSTPATLAKVRRSVIEQIKLFEKTGMQWERRKSNQSEDQEGK